jgi:hypothetical protein
MKTLKVEDIYSAGYETSADVVARLRRFIGDVYNAKWIAFLALFQGIMPETSILNCSDLSIRIRNLYPQAPVLYEPQKYKSAV